MTALHDECVDLQREAMALLLSIQKQVADLERATEQARVTSTLFKRATRLAGVFGEKAELLQSKATRRSIALHIQRLRLGVLVDQHERLAGLAGGDRPVQLSRAKSDLAEIRRLIDQWGTRPGTPAEVEGDHDVHGQ